MIDTENLLKLADNLEWQPIKTAPKDGTRILAKKGNLIISVRWGKRNYNHNGEGWRGFTGSKPPTHWMPLPDGKAAKAIRALIAERDAYREALKDIKNHGVSQPEAMNIPEEQTNMRNDEVLKIANKPTAGSSIYKYVEEALTRANELAGDKNA